MSSKGKDRKVKDEKGKFGDKKDKIKKRNDSFKIELTKIGYLEENTGVGKDYICDISC